MVIIMQPTIGFKSYSTLSLLAVVYISHISALFFLFILVITLVDWIITRRDKILLLYSVSFSLTAIAIITSLFYATIVFQSTIKYETIFYSPALLNLPRADLAIYFGPALDIISILSFVSVWIASAVLLHTYSRRIGKIRYWTIISIPLIYFLFPFEKNVLIYFNLLSFHLRYHME